MVSSLQNFANKVVAISTNLTPVTRSISLCLAVHGSFNKSFLRYERGFLAIISVCSESLTMCCFGQYQSLDKRSHNWQDYSLYVYHLMSIGSGVASKCRICYQESILEIEFVVINESSYKI